MARLTPAALLVMTERKPLLVMTGIKNKPTIRHCEQGEAEAWQSQKQT